MEYRRLTEGLNDKGKLIPAHSDIFSYISDRNKDYYLSTYKYTEKHREQFLEHGTIAGITDVVTEKIWWDFDSEFDPDTAKADTIKLVNKLILKGIEKEDIFIAFSGNKGFGVEVNLLETYTPKQIKSIAFELAENLSTFDTKMYNASRVFRVYGTRHNKTGLFKTPLTFNQLNELSSDNIMKLASSFPKWDNEFRWDAVTSPFIVNKEHESIIEERVENLIPTLDYSMKPKFLSNCRWAIQNGYFKQGDRNIALLCLGSTYKNMGFTIEHVYRLLKGVAELQSKYSQTERFSDSELFNNIIKVVFAATWNNGQYTCREDKNWLHTFCSKLEHPCNHKTEDELKPRTFMDLKDDFKHYVKNIHKNTILTGLPSIDKNVFLSTGANVGIIGAAGSGKTTVALEILNHTSKAGVRSVCASLDMAKNRIFEKILYRLTGHDRTELYRIFQDNEEEPILNQLKEEFGNVQFFKKSSPTVQDIKDYIIKCNEVSDEKIKLVVIDYFERVSSDFSDDTQASKKVAGELQDLVDDLDVCLITLVQPNKFALVGGPDQPIYDYTKIKGSSFVYQAFRIIISCWRPFFNPKTFMNDKYMQMAVLKNDLGELAEFEFNWEGKRGIISEMEDFQHAEFEELLRQKVETKKDTLF